MNDVQAKLKDRSAVFIGLARDCARHLPLVLQNMQNIASLFGRAGFVLAENDSQDATADILRAFGTRRAEFHLLNFDGIERKLPQRTRRLAFLRNRCLSVIRANARLRASDYLIVMDLDDATIEPLDRDRLVRAFAFLDGQADAAGVFGNCRGLYYDMWALRSDRLCPGDFWEEQYDYVIAHRVDDETAFAETCAKHLVTIPETDPPIPVTSAFGGLAIYKMPWTAHARYKG
jgi:glycosyltransferase involved in cell wall biosynthesis